MMANCDIILYQTLKCGRITAMVYKFQVCPSVVMLPMSEEHFKLNFNI